MIRKPIGKTSWFSVLLIIAAVTLWVIDQKRSAESPDKQQSHQAPSRNPTEENPSSNNETRGDYEVYRDCTLAEVRNNDGDSFMVRLPGGKQAEFRLYFVDAPESAFKSYAGGETNHERIRQQAAEMGGITSEQAVEIGKKAKLFTLTLLGRQPFTIFTRWDSPFHDQRYHAFVEVSENNQARWLDELLIERGLVRMKTKPAMMPDGTPAARHAEHLRELEREAKRKAVGAWGL
ncbi:MAG: hypothetical protein H8M99_09530 [Gloeobacteraceae cyanobacterium ES-bin-144]|nr:hypothetical protein [Verrucomicrobiales bacterium]